MLQTNRYLINIRENCTHLVYDVETIQKKIRIIKKNIIQKSIEKLYQNQEV